MTPLIAGVALAAYCAVLVQVGVFGAWPLLGGAQPHLIALGAVVFLVGGRLDLGLAWILVGGAFYDLLLPLRFGWTLLPLIVTYGILLLVLRRFFDAPTWIGTMALSTALLLGTELPVVIRFGLWQQLMLDMSVGFLIVSPFAAFLVRRLDLRRQGLTVR